MRTFSLFWISVLVTVCSVVCPPVSIGPRWGMRDSHRAHGPGLPKHGPPFNARWPYHGPRPHPFGHHHMMPPRWRHDSPMGKRGIQPGPFDPNHPNPDVGKEQYQPSQMGVARFGPHDENVDVQNHAESGNAVNNEHVSSNTTSTSSASSSEKHQPIKSMENPDGKTINEEKTNAQKTHFAVTAGSDGELGTVQHLSAADEIPVSGDSGKTMGTSSEAEKSSVSKTDVEHDSSLPETVSAKSKASEEGKSTQVVETVHVNGKPSLPASSQNDKPPTSPEEARHEDVRVNKPRGPFEGDKPAPPHPPPGPPQPERAIRDAPHPPPFAPQMGRPRPPPPPFNPINEREGPNDGPQPFPENHPPPRHLPRRDVNGERPPIPPPDMRREPEQFHFDAEKPVLDIFRGQFNQPNPVPTETAKREDSTSLDGAAPQHAKVTSIKQTERANAELSTTAKPTAAQESSSSGSSKLVSVRHQTAAKSATISKVNGNDANSSKTSSSSSKTSSEDKLTEAQNNGNAADVSQPFKSSFNQQPSSPQFEMHMPPRRHGTHHDEFPPPPPPPHPMHRGHHAPHPLFKGVLVNGPRDHVKWSNSPVVRPVRGQGVIIKNQPQRDPTSWIFFRMNIDKKGVLNINVGPQPGFKDTESSNSTITPDSSDDDVVDDGNALSPVSNIRQAPKPATIPPKVETDFESGTEPLPFPSSSSSSNVKGISSTVNAPVSPGDVSLTFFDEARINIDNAKESGCAPLKDCNVKCHGNLVKLNENTGCPVCDCCAITSCTNQCPNGFQGDKDGCPTCYCV